MDSDPKCFVPQGYSWWLFWGVLTSGAILQQNYIATFGGGRRGKGRWDVYGAVYDSFTKQWSQFKSFDDVEASIWN